MSEATCSVEGCERAHRCKGYCGLHYDRVRAYGTPDLPQRPERVCSVEACGRKVQGNGYCNAHYLRVKTHGDPLAHAPIQSRPTADERDDIEARILAKCVELHDGCIEWQGTALPSGYGVISWHGRPWVVHRAMWTSKVGPIPTDDDWTIDHLCRNRRCVNVAHLEVVTRTVNSLRGGGLVKAWQRLRDPRFKRTHCKRGHEYTETNTYTSTTGSRSCRACHADRQRQRRRAQRKRAA